MQRKKRLKLAENRQGYAFSMREKWDLRSVRHILSRPSSMLDQDGNLDAGLETLLQNILVEANNNKASERVTVKYYANEASVPFQIKGGGICARLANCAWVGPSAVCAQVLP